MHLPLGHQPAQVVEQHDPVGNRRPIIAAQVQLPDFVVRGRRHRALSGRFPLKGLVVQHGKTLVGGDHKVNLDAGAEPHGLQNAGTCEHRIARLAAGAMPFEPGTVTIALDIEGIGHLSSDKPGHCCGRPRWPWAAGRPSGRR